MPNPLANANPFDELGRILSAGGERAAITEAMRGSGGSELLAFILGRYSRLSPEQAGQLAEHVTDSIAAAGIAREVNAAESLQLDTIPVNPLLYGNDPEGRRIRADVEAVVVDTATGGERTIRLNVDFPTPPSMDEIREAVLSAIEEIFDQYPEKFGDWEAGDIDDVNLTLNALERRY